VLEAGEGLEELRDLAQAQDHGEFLLLAREGEMLDGPVPPEGGPVEEPLG
jgi:hypothetical protein